MINFSSAPDDQQNAKQVKGKIDKKNVCGKMLYFFYFRHDLGNAEKNTHPGQKQHNTPDELKFVFLVRHCLLYQRAFERCFAFFKKSRSTFFSIGTAIAQAKAFNFDMDAGGQICI